MRAIVRTGRSSRQSAACCRWRCADGFRCHLYAKPPASPAHRQGSYTSTYSGIPPGEAAVEALDIGIVRRLFRSGEVQRHPVDIGPVLQHLRDLLAVTRNYTYFRAYGGWFSIKKVAPRSAPSISYDGLEAVSDGGAASAAYTNLAAGLIRNKAKVSELRKAHLEYCKLDTLAMVEVDRALLKLS